MSEREIALSLGLDPDALPPGEALRALRDVQQSNPLCKCGDRLSRHDEYGCTWNPDCLCMKFEAADSSGAA